MSKVSQLERIGNLVTENISATARAVAAERRATDAEAKLAAQPPPAPAAPPAPAPVPDPLVQRIAQLRAMPYSARRNIELANAINAQDKQARLTGAARR